MKRTLSFGLAVGLLFFFSRVFAADKVRVTGGGMTPLHAIIWVASQQGFLK